MFKLWPEKFNRNSAAKMDTGTGGDLQFVQRIGDQAGIVRDLVNGDAGQVLAEAGQGFAHFGRDAHGVGAGLLVDRQTHAFHAIDQHQMVDLGIHHRHRAEVGHPHRLAGAARRLRIVHVAHHHRRDIVGAAEAGQAADLEHPVVLLQGAGGDVDVLAAQAVLQQAQRYAEGFQPVAIHRHADFLLPAAGDAHFGDSGKLFQRRGHLAPRQTPQFRKVRLPRGRHQAQGEDRRLTRIEAPHQHLVDFGIALDGADGLLHIDKGNVEIDVPVEDHRGHQPPGTRHLFDFADAAHGEQHLLDAFAVQALHLRGRPVAGAGGHHHGGALQIGEQVHRQFAPGQPAHQRHRQGNHADGHRPARGQGGKGFEHRHPDNPAQRQDAPSTRRTRTESTARQRAKASTVERTSAKTPGTAASLRHSMAKSSLPALAEVVMDWTPQFVIKRCSRGSAPRFSISCAERLPARMDTNTTGSSAAADRLAERRVFKPQDPMTRTRAPSVSVSRPRTTMRSPRDRPSRICT